MDQEQRPSRLARPVGTRDGGVLGARDDARQYVAALLDRRATYRAWRYAAKLKLDGADAEQSTGSVPYA